MLTDLRRYLNHEYPSSTMSELPPYSERRYIGENDEQFYTLTGLFYRVDPNALIQFLQLSQEHNSNEKNVDDKYPTEFVDEFQKYTRNVNENETYWVFELELYDSDCRGGPSYYSDYCVPATVDETALTATVLGKTVPIMRLFGDDDDSSTERIDSYQLANELTIQ